jgi:endonuclease YncB( thermonuclease family)
MIPLTLLALLLPTPYTEVPATITRVIDGDTVEVRAHLPFDVHVDLVVRVAGIDCPEMKGLQGTRVS